MKKILIIFVILSLIITLPGCKKTGILDPDLELEQESLETFVIIKNTEYPLDIARLTISRKEVSDSDVELIGNLRELVFLELKINDITKISSLSRLTKLEELDLGFNYISDISPLSGLTNLTRLDLRANKISNLSGLENLENLTELNLGSNDIMDITPLKKLTNLNNLYLNDNSIEESDYIVLRAALPDCNVYF
ncbi:MAG: leucine-rich repeat domain-containing protein [Oscillospiraceae bacterium]|nr:leucine-rich repeat domain-containing protein [Oscillospiraceae bacterium]